MPLLLVALSWRILTQALRSAAAIKAAKRSTTVVSLSSRMMAPASLASLMMSSQFMLAPSANDMKQR
jgi:hypothetical protein